MNNFFKNENFFGPNFSLTPHTVTYSNYLLFDFWKYLLNIFFLWFGFLDPKPLLDLYSLLIYL
jgi:hypothetical protein